MTQVLKEHIELLGDTLIFDFRIINLQIHHLKALLTPKTLPNHQKPDDAYENCAANLASRSSNQANRPVLSPLDDRADARLRL